jgi:hypothetical protein
MGGVAICDIDGDHVSILRNPDVRALAEKLDNALRNSESGSESGIATTDITPSKTSKGVKADPAEILMDAEPVAGSSR